ncbi:hypothetical protein OKA04_16505 [Luteolibacter flavescens]|uniref:Sialate O-acetylesterase domain-containing protein n=1 Tax=Luteolibacter flavescens TaxID=1859460 RepID=A0ABT3FSX4_9BACT|nr:LamG-like jellyroll fold domain-containing protein [Luteolibacter flavescens]MCW1886341.1 hypothetical protein [Luteolibacter flavescens]
MNPSRLIPCALLLQILPATAGVWAHYSFDTSFDDVSGNNRHGTLTDNGTLGNSGIISTPGDFKFGNGAMNFHADRDFIAIPSKTFGSGLSYTVAFWARKSPGDTGGASQWDMVIGQRDNANHFIGLNDASGTGMRWRGSSNAADREANFGVPLDYDWHHYAIVAYGSTITLYLDGQFFGTVGGKQTGFIIDTIGEAYTAAADYDFNGQIDEVWIFEDALGPDKISSLYLSNDPDAGGPYAGFHYRFDENLNDSGSGAFHGATEGNAALTTDPQRVVEGSGALWTDGADASRMVLPVPGYYTATQPWTATWWARREGIGSSKGMVMGRADNTNDFIWLNDTNPGLRFRSSTGATLDFTAPKGSQLRHYALVADGMGNMTLFIDGQESETLAGNTSFAVDSIGKAYPTTTLKYNFHGTLDEVRLMPSALTATQVATIYNDEKPVETPSTATKVRVILLGGQSNADGRAAITGLPAALQSSQADVDFYYRIEGGAGSLTTLQPGLSETSQFGPEIVLGRRLADLYAHEAGTRVAIIKYANGGTNLHTQWKAGGDATTTGDGPEYVTFQQTVTAGLAALAAKHPLATVEIDSMVWMQGEADASAAQAGNYQANLGTFIADARATFGPSLAFVIGRLSSGQTSIDGTWRGQVQAAQDAVAAADPRTSVLSTDGFGMAGDNLHFDASGQQSLGSGFAEESAYYSWMMEHFSPADIDAGRGAPDADFDGDGQSNRTEFLGASNPSQGESRFMASFTRTGAATGSISYVSTPARLYAVERLVEASGTWQVELPFAAGENGTTVRPLNTPAARGIYRVTSKLP